MGKNQHVVPDSNGGWNVKGAGNTKATVHTDTKAEATKIARGFLKIKDQNCLFMVETVKFKVVIVMETIHILQRVNHI